ncbi:MAG: hypothetical protein WKF84_28060 [Pyrinomonadaceae bacterium]
MPVRAPKYVPVSVSPLANVHVKIPLSNAAGSGGVMQWLCTDVYAPKLEVPVELPVLGLMLTVNVGEHLPPGLAGGP